MRPSLLAKLTTAAALIVAAATIGAALPIPVAGPQTFGAITMSVMPRIITPNGDGRNDVLFFKFDSDVSGVPIDARIMDLSGAQIVSPSLNSNGDALTWDGKDDSGRIVPSGIYLYALKIGTKIATGTIVVAR
ncbi:MAG: gliding motility-associated C-terminal domain-containing protein [Elusimicrobia bacterium]|nr:gliding motility-associated C-terminal domain-containing protein [Elusimicrobiota bacterium]